MDRANFTITTKNDISYDANHISIEKQIVNDVAHSQVSFLCSGIRTTLMADAIKEIVFNNHGATWCSECDNSISHIN